MATEAQPLSQAEALNRVFASYRTFLENVFALMRYLEAELTKHDWEMVRGSGYAVTRNGWGSGLASFASADWAITEIGIALVPVGLAKTTTEYTNTPVPKDGLVVLYFQVRWLDKSPDGPAVWFGRLIATPGPSGEARKWEEHQTEAFKRLEAANLSESEAGSGALKPFQVAKSGLQVNVVGDYTAVPVTELLNESDVARKLVQPALAQFAAITEDLGEETLREM
jgi:hypothetical protein